MIGALEGLVLITGGPAAFPASCSFCWLPSPKAENSSSGSLDLCILTFGDELFFVVGAVLYIVECLAAPLASTYYPPIASPPRCDKQKCLHLVNCSQGAKSAPIENHWSPLKPA